MSAYEETSESLVKKVIQPRRRDAHKGDNGVVCVIGGSRIFHGAPYFASVSALRAGADLVYLAVPRLIADPIRALGPELIVFPISDAKLTKGAADAILKWLPAIDSLAIGPGIGRQNLDGVRKLIADICVERKVRASIDAEAQNIDLFTLIKGRDCVTTPHPGEFRRVFGKDPGGSLEEKIASAREKAAEYKITIVLKGFETVITDGTSVFVNKEGSPAMTCGGIGDTLSGVIGSLLAQSAGTSVRSVDVAAAASFIVGRAGSVAAESKGFHIVATDIIEQIPYVMKQFDRVI